MIPGKIDNLKKTNAVGVVAAAAAAVVVYFPYFTLCYDFIFTAISTTLCSMADMDAILAVVLYCMPYILLNDQQGSSEQLYVVKK